MSNYLRAYTALKVYENHSESSKQLGSIEKDTLVKFNREKRREGINWMEIYLYNGEKAYVKKDYTKFFLCENSVLNDDEAIGISYELKTGENKGFYQLFNLIGDDNLSSESHLHQVSLTTIHDNEKHKISFLNIVYNPQEVDVQTISFKEKSEFLITSRGNKENPFLEIDDLKGTKGILLNDTSCSKQKDQWLGGVALIVGIAIVVGIILVSLENGWLVIGGFLMIPAIVGSLIVVIVIKLSIVILRSSFNQIRKRF